VSGTGVGMVGNVGDTTVVAMVATPVVEGSANVGNPRSSGSGAYPCLEVEIFWSQ